MRPFIAFQSFMRGYSYTELGEPLKAVKHLKRSLSLNDKNDQAWSLLGYNLKKLDQIEESKQAYKKALDLNPDDYQAALEFALIYFYENDFDQAIRILKKHLKKTQDQLGGWLILARCYEKAGQRKKAIETYRLIYHQIDPGNAVAKERLSQYNSL
jgi:Tfp pilus assembly protein PilF